MKKVKSLGLALLAFARSIFGACEITQRQSHYLGWKYARINFPQCR